MTPRQVRREHDRRPVRRNEPRGPDPDRHHLAQRVDPDRLHQLVDHRDDRVLHDVGRLRPVRGVAPCPRDDLARRVDDTARDLGPADVDPDRQMRRSSRLLAEVGARPRRPRSRSPAPPPGTGAVGAPRSRATGSPRRPAACRSSRRRGRPAGPGSPAARCARPAAAGIPGRDGRPHRPRRRRVRPRARDRRSGTIPCSPRRPPASGRSGMPGSPRRRSGDPSRRGPGQQMRRAAGLVSSATDPTGRRSSAMGDLPHTVVVPVLVRSAARSRPARPQLGVGREGRPAAPRRVPARRDDAPPQHRRQAEHPAVVAHRHRAARHRAA